MYFLPRTCRDKKWIASYFVLTDETLRGVFLLQRTPTFMLDKRYGVSKLIIAQSLSIKEPNPQDLQMKKGFEAKRFEGTE